MPLVTRNSTQGNLFKESTTPNWANGDLWSDTTDNKVKLNVDGVATDVGATSFSGAAVVSQSTTIGDYTTPSGATGSSDVGGGTGTVEYLVVGGGGSGGYQSGFTGAGGGAGGFRTNTGFSITAQDYSITVGAGGTNNTAGGNSTFSTITATGGGRGGVSYMFAGGNGGSGGGAGSSEESAGTGISGQGNNGGNGDGGGNGGGGGGFSAVGGNSVQGTRGGHGGAGTTSTISGSSVNFCAGGGGGAAYQQTGGNGGATGGGAGGNYQVSGSNATSYGSGGGGSGQNGAVGGNGYQGLVVIKFITGTISATGGTITTSGGYTIHTFTSSGTFSVSAILTIGNVWDNNTATKWTSQAQTNPYCYVDLGSSLNFCAAAFYWNGVDTTETQLKIQTSADASTWTDKRTITTSNLTNGAYNYYRFNIANARYVRFYGSSGASRVLSIWEIKILSKTDAQVFADLGILEISSSDTSLGPNGT